MRSHDDQRPGSRPIREASATIADDALRLDAADPVDITVAMDVTRSRTRKRG
jgi:hypothetical protein